MKLIIPHGIEDNPVNVQTQVIIPIITVQGSIRYHLPLGRQQYKISD